MWLLLPSTLHAQYDRRGYTLTADSDTVTWQKYLTENEVKYNLEPIRNSTADFSFRLAWYGTTIDVYQNDSVAHGFINLFAEEYENGRNTGNTFKLTVTLNPQQAKDILAVIKESAANTIPSEVHFKLSGHRKDGVTYNLEQKSGCTYSCKNYWSPKGSSLNEFIIIASLIEEVQKISGYTAL